MLSRIFWIGIAGAALVIGMVVQDGDGFLWGHDDATIDARIDRIVDGSAIDSGIDRAVDRSVDSMQVVGSDGREIDVPAEAKQAMAEAVGRLLKAEAALAVLRIRDGSAEERVAAEAARDHARSDVDRLKMQIKRLEQAQGVDQQALREQIQRQVRDEVRASIREAARN